MQRMPGNWQDQEEDLIMRDIKDLSNSEITALIDEWINGRNAERDRKILKRRLIDGICYEPLADEFDLSVRRVKKIVYQSELKLFNHIK